MLEAWKCLEQIKRLDRTQERRFNILKNKAAKYVKRAQEINKDAKIFVPNASPSAGGGRSSSVASPPSADGDGILRSHNEKS